MGMGLSIHEQEHKDPEVRSPTIMVAWNNLSNPYPRLLLTSSQLEMSKSGINNWKN